MKFSRITKSLWTAGILLLVLVLFFGAAQAKGKPDKGKPSPPNFQTHPQQNGQSAPAQPLTPGGTPLYANLSGAEEVPGPGDQDGSGLARLRLNQGRGTICFELQVSGITTSTAAHIHSGASGVAGPVVVTLTAPISGVSQGCVSVAKDLAKTIRKNPAGYYVNVHNAQFPAGAVRGQLSK